MRRSHFLLPAAALLVVVGVSAPVSAKEGAASGPVIGPPLPYGFVAGERDRDGLPVNTEVSLRLNTTVSSKDAEEGDVFGLTVAEDVKLNGQVLIPAGTQATGRVMGVTRRSIPGQPGRLLIELRSIDFADRVIPVSGTYYERGAVDNGTRFSNPIGAALVGLFVTGRSAAFHQGMLLKAYTRQPVRSRTAAR